MAHILIIFYILREELNKRCLLKIFLIHKDFTRKIDGYKHFYSLLYTLYLTLKEKFIGILKHTFLAHKPDYRKRF